MFPLVGRRQNRLYGEKSCTVVALSCASSFAAHVFRHGGCSSCSYCLQYNHAKWSICPAGVWIWSKNKLNLISACNDLDSIQCFATWNTLSSVGIIIDCIPVLQETDFKWVVEEGSCHLWKFLSVLKTFWIRFSWRPTARTAVCSYGFAVSLC